MMLVTVLVCVIALASGQGTGPCPSCLFPLWYTSVNLQGTELCSSFQLDNLFGCITNCDIDPADKPESFKIRQLTQISDIFTALRNNTCVDGVCDELMECLSEVTNYESPQGSTTHAPYPTVFNFKCNVEDLELALTCIDESKGCVDDSTASALKSIIGLGVDAACNDPRRCVAHANIFEVVPGTKCDQYYQEAAAYGPSTGNPISTLEDLLFDPVTCTAEHRDKVTCPEDSEAVQIFSEFPPPSTDEEEEEEAEPTTFDYGGVTVNVTESCVNCVQPVWYAAVVEGGIGSCDESFQSLITRCLEACKDKPSSPQHQTELLVKLADLNKVFATNGCGGYAGCSSTVYNCTDSIAIFEPIVAPDHTTVNTLNCSAGAIEATLECIDRECVDDSLVSLFNPAIIKGYNGICNTELRCMTYGNIYEYVTVPEIEETVANNERYEDVTPCAYYRHSAVNGWFKNAVARVQPNLLFDTNNCWADFPENANCPAELLGGQ